MSRLNELIQGLCPNGVLFQSVDMLIKCNIIKTITPSIKIKRSDYKEMGRTPIISQEMELISGYCEIEDKNIPANNYVCFGDHSEQMKYVDFSFVQGADGLKIMCMDESVLNSRFFYYSVLNYYTKHNSYERHFKYLLDTIIPVPPLRVQEEIVRILDEFTGKIFELQERLKEELQARKRQYEYYANKMFPSVKNRNIEWVELGGVATVTKLAGFEFTNYVTYSETGNIIALRGLNVKNGRLVLDDVKYIDNSQLEMLTRSKLHIGDMLFTYVGTIGQVALVDEEERFYLAPNVAMVRLNTEQYLPRYMMYYFLTEKFRCEQISKLLQTSSMQNIPMEKIRKFMLPKLSIAEQEKVISFLKRFDELYNDISEGLLVEFDVRQKQYEYYRNKLLTFKERTI